MRRQFDGEVQRLDRSGVRAVRGSRIRCRAHGRDQRLVGRRRDRHDRVAGVDRPLERVRVDDLHDVGHLRDAEQRRDARHDVLAERRRRRQDMCVAALRGRRDLRRIGGGQRMRIVLNDEELEKGVLSLLKHLPGNKILIDHFLDRCQEAEIDAIFDGDDFHVMGVMEHIEPAGIHSGDSNAVLPQFNLTPLVVTTMEHYAEKIARALHIKGLINIQFAIKDGNVFVIEANPRASRTTPFIAKAYEIPYLNIATKIMLGDAKLKDFTFEKKMKGFAIKEPVFSFNKFPGVNKELGPEMKSTGEAIRFIKDLRDPYFRNLYKERSMHLSK